MKHLNSVDDWRRGEAFWIWSHGKTTVSTTAVKPKESICGFGFRCGFPSYFVYYSEGVGKKFHLDDLAPEALQSLLKPMEKWLNDKSVESSSQWWKPGRFHENWSRLLSGVMDALRERRDLSVAIEENRNGLRYILPLNEDYLWFLRYVKIAFRICVHSNYEIAGIWTVRLLAKWICLMKERSRALSFIVP